MTLAATSPPDADRLGRYELVRELGHGGMADVWLARTRGPAGFQKWFAIKRIDERMAKDREFVDMFLDEARLAASLQHPNVVQTIELGQEGGQYFIAMEYLHGEPLSAVMRRSLERNGPMDPVLAAYLCAQAAEGLHHAHEARDGDDEPLQLVHRDVSPHNIFVTYEGRVVLTDFGVAKARGRLTQTETGLVKGKIAYSPPEMLRGESVDRRVDVFALGVVLFELTTGKRLFKGNSDAETLQRIYSGHRVEPSTWVPDYPDALAAILADALAHDVKDRTPSALAMARSLRAFVSGAVDGSDVKREMAALFEEEITEKSAVLRRRDAAHARAPSSSEAAPAPARPVADAAVDRPSRRDEPSQSHTRSTIPPTPPSRGWLWGLLAVGVAAAALLAWRSIPTSGVVRIDSVPSGAAVYVDGERRGTTPALLESVAAGPHEVRLEQEGYAPFEAPFSLRGDRVELSYAMRPTSDVPEPGPGAEERAGSSAGPAPGAATADESTEPGTTDPAEPTSNDTASNEPASNDAASGASDAPGESDAPDPAAESAPASPTPPRRPRVVTTGRFSLVTSPWARVWINGRDAGYTPLVGVEVPAGRVRVRLQPRGEGPSVTRTYRIVAGETTQDRITLSE